MNTATYYELGAAHAELFQLCENKNAYTHEGFIGKAIGLREFLYNFDGDALSKEFGALENVVIKHREIAPYRK